MLPIRVFLAPLLLTAIAQISTSQLASADSVPKSEAKPSSKLPDEVLSDVKADGSLHKPSPQELSRLKKLDQRYQNAKSVTMDLEKVLKLGVLGTERNSSGRLFISQGRLRMEIDKPDQSLVVVNKKNIWVVQYPPEDLKGAALQVIRASSETKKGRSQSFIGLLVKGGITKYFKVLGTVTNSDKTTTYFLQPDKGTVEFARAQVTLDEKGEELREIKYWDELNNETTFRFTKVSLNKKIAADKFEYTPPKNADVTQY